MYLIRFIGKKKIKKRLISKFYLFFFAKKIKQFNNQKTKKLNFIQNPFSYIIFNEISIPSAHPLNSSKLLVHVKTRHCFR